MLNFKLCNRDAVSICGYCTETCLETCGTDLGKAMGRICCLRDRS